MGLGAAGKTIVARFQDPGDSAPNDVAHVAKTIRPAGPYGGDTRLSPICAMRNGGGKRAQQRKAAQA